MWDYKKFCNIHMLSEKERQHIEVDFFEKVQDVLFPLSCDGQCIDSIAMSLFESMCSRRVYYHTPIHIMSIFSFAKENDIKLTSAEELAILFHDAIYRPGSKFSENLSIRFMESLLSETGVPAEQINNAGSIISATARHLTDNDEEHKLVMDLDMSGFSAAPGEFMFQGEMIEKEFHNGHRTDLYTLDQFLIGRLKFLTKLQERKSIYRTPMFLKKFEKRAQTNLANAINEVLRRLESKP